MQDTPKRIQVLGGLLRHLGTFDMRQFSGRLVLQKTVYLLQEMGFFLGYRFNWYIYGPYSPELARHGFDLTKSLKDIPPYQFANENNESQFQRFVAFLGDKKSDAIWLEAVASIHFQKKLRPSRAKEEIIQQVVAKQPYFSPTICKDAWKALEDANLLSAESR
jgi:uncharacterized protein YwgA